MKRFALIGGAGYIAPRHYQAINHVNGELVAICDTSDSVGIIDRYNQEALYFSEVERFDRFLDKMKRTNPIDYLVVCTPNIFPGSPDAPVQVTTNESPGDTSKTISVMGDKLQTVFGNALLPGATEIVGVPTTLITPFTVVGSQFPPEVDTV